MDFLERMRQLFTPAKPPDRYQWIEVRCKRCGEVLRARIDTFNDLSEECDARGNVTGYTCRKAVSGDGKNLCFQVIELVLEYDGRKRLKESGISGGEFVTPQGK